MTSAVTIVCNVATIRGTFNHRIVIQTEMTDDQQKEAVKTIAGDNEGVREWLESIVPAEFAAVRAEGVQQGHAEAMGGVRP